MMKVRQGDKDTAREGTRLDRWREKLPQGTAGRQLTAMALIDALGTGVFLSVSVLFLTGAVGLSVGQVSTGLALAAGAGLLTTLPTGMLADRWGVRRLLVIVAVWRALCMVVYAFVPGFVSFLVVAVLMGCVDKAMAPLVQALVGMAVPEADRVRTMAVMGALRNAGYSVGALSGSVALALDTRASYTAVLLCGGALLMALATVAARIPLLPGKVTDPSHLGRRLSVRILTDRPFLAIAVLNVVLAMHLSLLTVGLPLWVSTATTAPRWMVSVLLAVNTALAVLFQVRASRGAGDLTKAAKLMRVSGFSLAVACLLLAATPSFSVVPAAGLLVLGVAALTASELFQSAGGWGISYQLAREGQEATYIALFWLSVGAQQVIGPLLINQLIHGGTLAWAVLAAVQVAAGLAVPPVTRWAARTRSAEKALAYCGSD